MVGWHEQTHNDWWQAYKTNYMYIGLQNNWKQQLQWNGISTEVNKNKKNIHLVTKNKGTKALLSLNIDLL